jgi:hypothetical protein
MDRMRRARFRARSARLSHLRRGQAADRTYSQQRIARSMIIAFEKLAAGPARPDRTVDWAAGDKTSANPTQSNTHTYGWENLMRRRMGVGDAALAT